LIAHIRVADAAHPLLDILSSACAARRQISTKAGAGPRLKAVSPRIDSMPGLAGRHLLFPAIAGRLCSRRRCATRKPQTVLSEADR